MLFILSEIAKTLLWYFSGAPFLPKVLKIIFMFLWLTKHLKFSLNSVQFIHPVVSNSLRPHEPQHTRLPCPLPALKLMSTESVMLSNHLILCHPVLLLPSIFPSIRVFSNESVLHIRWPKYWSFNFNISPSNKHPGLIFRMDWFHLVGYLV